MKSIYYVVGIWIAMTAPTVFPTAQAAETEVAVSTMTPKTPTELYKTERLRDPFMPIIGGSYKTGESTEPFDLHALVLKGLMQDKTGDYAILVQPNAGTTYILKNGKLLDFKNKPVPGVTGAVKLKQKTVHVMTSDKDVQTLILGEQPEGT